MINRRGLITGLVSLIAAPAIIRVNHLMPISVSKLIVPIDPYPPGIYNMYNMQTVMKDGVIITDWQLANEVRKYIRATMRVP